MPARISLIIAILIEIVLTYNFCTRLVSLLETQKRIDVARASRDGVKNEFQKKSNDLKYVLTDSYVEDIARRKLRYGREGEHIYIIASDKSRRVELDEVKFDDVSLGQRLGGQIGNWINLFFK